MPSSDDDEEVGRVRFKIVSGPSIPYSIVSIIQSNGSMMLSIEEAGHNQHDRSSMFVRFGTYSVLLTTDFQGGEVGGVEGVIFHVRIRKRRVKTETNAVMVIEFYSEEVAEENVAVLTQTTQKSAVVVEDRKPANDGKPPIDDAWRRRAS